VVAFLGLFALPFCWVIALGALYLDFASNPLLRGAVTGVGVAGGGLFIGTAIKLGTALVKKPAAIALVFAIFLALGIGRVSMLYVLPLGAAFALLAARRGWL
jgi:chromate transport protein ChrA